MIITLIEHNLELALPSPEMAPRSKGLHMSDIYNDLYQDLEPNRFKRGTPMDEQRLEMGLMFEEMLEQGLARRLGEQLGERPGEFHITVEGSKGPVRIYYTPDLLFWEPDVGIRLGEIKLTWMSSREVPRNAGVDNFPPKFDKYFTQTKAYCFAIGATHARLYIMFVNGDYRPPTPELLAWDVEFDEIELQENWSMLMNHARSKGML